MNNPPVEISLAIFEGPEKKISEMFELVDGKWMSFAEYLKAYEVKPISFSTAVFFSKKENGDWQSPAGGNGGQFTYEPKSQEIGFPLSTQMAMEIVKLYTKLYPENKTTQFIFWATKAME